MTQKEALDILKTGANVYLTGAAGSGKTYVLNSYIDYLKKHSIEVGVTASTGIAATHMNGVTIHSWSGLGIRDYLAPHDIEGILEKEYLWKRFDRTKVLIIDEVSMLAHYRLDMVDQLARAMKRVDEPFGGMQVVLCGDFFQLPPIARPGEREAHFIYKSDVWRDSGFRVCYLEEQWRQEDVSLLDVLNAIRRNDVTEATVEHLEGSKDRELSIPPTRLYTHNIDVDSINGRELGGIAGGERVYEMRSRGVPALAEILRRSCLAPERLVLKKGARVMFVKNNFEAGYVNGTLGEVVGFDAMGQPEVKVRGGEVIAAEEASWSVEEEGKIKAEITQVPLRLAWAITVHKSQGMSLDAVEVDLSKSFVPGMGYVALSRVRTLQGLRLLGFNNQALRVNEEVLMFDEDLLSGSADSRVWLEHIGTAEKKKLHDEFVGRSTAAPKQKKLPTEEKTLELVGKKLSIYAMAQERGVTEDTIVGHLEKLLSKNPKLDLSHIRPHSSLLEKVGKAFKKAGDGKLSSARAALGNKVSFLELKIARLFIEE